MKTRRLAFDIKEMKPGCVLLQAALGTDFGTGLELFFASEYWLTFPTPDMRVYEITDEQLVQLVKKVEEANP